jgi:methylmalonyl-CoA mutase
MEIAKLRAARMLYARIIEQYEPKNERSFKCFFHCTNSRWNKTVFDPYTNLLRATTEAMSAIIGGTDCLTIQPFDMSFREPDASSIRLSRNIQNILRNESYFSKVADPAGGSYYVEMLTDAVAREAWELFKKVQSLGGFYEAAEKGFIQDELEKTNQVRMSMITGRKDNILGTSIYPDFNETVLDQISTLDLSEEAPEGKYVRTIQLYRKAELFEKIRLNTEKYVSEGGKTPRVFLLQIGNPGMSTARAIFSGNFFGTAGFEIISNPMFDTVEEAVAEAQSSGSDIVVICSSDDDYSLYAPPIAKQLKQKDKKLKVIVAGFPKDAVEQLKKEGVDDFIHLKLSLSESLKSYQAGFGII